MARTSWVCGRRVSRYTHFSRLVLVAASFLKQATCGAKGDGAALVFQGHKATCHRLSMQTHANGASAAVDAVKCMHQRHCCSACRHRAHVLRMWSQLAHSVYEIGANRGK